MNPLQGVSSPTGENEMTSKVKTSKSLASLDNGGNAERPSSASSLADNQNELVDVNTNYLTNCIPSWKQIFPWMHYVKESFVFLCSTCEWGSCDPNLITIFRITNPKDFHLVAKRLRDHNENADHKKIFHKRQQLSDLFKYLYPLLKGFSKEFSSLEEIVNIVTNLSGGNFPGPKDLTARYAFAGYMTKRIAECIEEEYLNALAESPCFSIVTLECEEFSIIRWLNSEGESEEHLFCTQISFPGQKMSCLSYLEMKNIDIKKLVSCTILPYAMGTDVGHESAFQVPVRFPLLEHFVSWVERASFIKELLEHLSVLTRLCKSNFHKFAGFPEAAYLMAMKEPFGHTCIMNEKVIRFFFKNIKALREIALDIHKKTRNMDAYGFSSLELHNPESLLRCACLFPKLNVILNEALSGSLDTYEALKGFKNDICARMKGEVELEGSEEYILLSLFNVFLAHVIVTLDSPGKSIVDILSKKSSDITIADLEKLISSLFNNYHGTSEECLAEFKGFQDILSEYQDFSLAEVLEVLDARSDLHQSYPEFCLLSKKIKVLPCYPAVIDQSFFNVASLHIFLSGRVAKHLKYPLSVIMLEGPSVGELNADHILDMWARKWKAGPEYKLDLSNIKEIVYRI